LFFNKFPLDNKLRYGTSGKKCIFISKENTTCRRRRRRSSRRRRRVGEEKRVANASEQGKRRNRGGNRETYQTKSQQSRTECRERPKADSFSITEGEK
jgi:hypothetical protein